MGAAASALCLGAMMASEPGSSTSLTWGVGGLAVFGVSRLIPRRRRRRSASKNADIPQPSEVQAQSPTVVRLPDGTLFEDDPSTAHLHPLLRAAFLTKAKARQPLP